VRATMLARFSDAMSSFRFTPRDRKIITDGPSFTDEDDNAFYRCLQKVVEHPDFSPESMGKYIASAKKRTLEEDYLAQCVVPCKERKTL
jgi:hypothetical protein